LTSKPQSLGKVVAFAAPTRFAVSAKVKDRTPFLATRLGPIAYGGST
jgi:hypothetical protein